MTARARAGRRFLWITCLLGLAVVIAQLIAVALATPLDPDWEPSPSWQPPTWFWLVLAGGALLTTVLALWYLALVLRHREALAEEAEGQPGLHVGGAVFDPLDPRGVKTAEGGPAWFVVGGIMAVFIAALTGSPVGALLAAAALALVARWATPGARGDELVRRIGLEHLAGLLALGAVPLGLGLWYVAAGVKAAGPDRELAGWTDWQRDALSSVPVVVSWLVLAVLVVGFAWRVVSLRTQAVSTRSRVSLFVLSVVSGAAVWVLGFPWVAPALVVIGVLAFVLPRPVESHPKVESR